MSKKGKKNQGGHDKQPNMSKEEKQEAAEAKGDNKQEMAKIMEAITNMDLDSKDFIDVKPFDEGKQILLNAIDDLHFYIDLFRKGDLGKFPPPTPSPAEELAAAKAK